MSDRVESAKKVFTEAYEGDGAYSTSDDPMAKSGGIRDAAWQGQVDAMKNDFHQKRAPGPKPSLGGGKEAKATHQYQCGKCGEVNEVAFDFGDDDGNDDSNGDEVTED
jgi:hypothetical protein